MLPAQICFYEGSILSAVQYAKGQFIVPSLAPMVYNLGIILGGVLLSPASESLDLRSAFSAERSPAISCCRFLARTAPAQNFRRTLTFAILAFGCS